MRNPVKTAKRQLLRVGSCALSALMVLGSIPAAAIGDGVTATYDGACPERWHDHLPVGRKGPARDLLL